MSFFEGLLWLTINIYNEAHMEPFKAKLAVAHVTLYRAKGELKNVRSVVSRPKQFTWTWMYKGKLNKKLFRQAEWLSDNWIIPKKMYSEFCVALFSLVVKDNNKYSHYRRFDFHNASWTCKSWESPDNKSEHVFCREKDLIKNKRRKK